MNIKEIFEIALSNVISPDDDYLYRKYCRQYSKLFSTPLHIVYELQPDLMLKTVYEYQLEQMEEEDLDLLADKTVNPDDYKEEDFDKFVEELEQIEKAKAEAKKMKPVKAPVMNQASDEGQSLNKPVVRKYDEDDI